MPYMVFCTHVVVTLWRKYGVYALIYPISFPNVKWIQISLKITMIELHSHLKIYLDCFPGKLKYDEFRRSAHPAIATHFEVEVIP